MISRAKSLICGFVIAVSATGCISLPKTESDMRSQAPIRNSFAVSVPLEDAFEVLLTNLDRCYGINLIGFGHMRTVAIGKMTGPDTATLQMRSDGSGSKGIGQLFDLQRASDSSTDITAYYLSIAGKNIRQIAPGWFSGSKRCE